MSVWLIAIIIIIILIVVFLIIRYAVVIPDEEETSVQPPPQIPIPEYGEGVPGEEEGNAGGEDNGNQPEPPSATCGDDLTAIGKNCYASCPDGTIPKPGDPTQCIYECPAGYTPGQSAGNCKKSSNAIVDLVCNGEGEILIEGGCYKTCPNGYQTINMKCYENCPNGFNTDTTYCSDIQTFNPNPPNCPNGYTLSNNQCQENCSGPDYEMIGNSCYRKCPAGFVPYLHNYNQYTCMRPSYNREGPNGEGIYGSMGDCEKVFGVGNCEKVAVGRYFKKCDPGYTQSGNSNDKQRCYLNCPESFSTLNADLCIRPIKTLSYQSVGCNYPDTTLQKNGMCYINGCQDPYKQDPEDPSICYLPCPSNFQTYGTRCLRPSYNMELTGQAVCPDGYELISGTCVANCPTGFKRANLAYDLAYCTADFIPRPTG